MRFNDITGKRFGRLVALEVHSKNRFNKYRWLCICDCGNQKDALAAKLHNGETRSCGCLRQETARSLQQTHGESQTRLYRIWARMIRRCNDPKEPSYPYYGGRGISVDKMWLKSYESFRDWSLQDGYSKDLTIDRIDVNGGYSPANCRWADRKTQANNTRSNRNITFNGVTRTLMQWSEETGISYSTLGKRLRIGVPIEKLFLTRRAKRYELQ